MRMTTTKLSLLLVFIFFNIFGILQAQDLDSRAGDEIFMQDLYDSAGGDNWYDKTGWNSGNMSLEDNPVGLTVAEVDGELRIVEVDMQKVTTVAPAGREEGPQHNGNNLRGVIPSSIGNLKKVIKFNVKQNKLTGQLPSEIGYMESLVRLSLAGQRGEIEIGTGETPDHRGQGGGKSFEETNAFDSELPAEWGKLTSIELIEIRHQWIKGTLPAEWGDMNTLRGIFIDNRRGSDSLTGSIPAEWGKLSNLENIYLMTGGSDRSPEESWGPGLTGEIPMEFQQGPTHGNQFRIFIGGNSFTGTTPIFSNITYMREYRIERNDFSGSFPIEIFNKGHHAGLYGFDISYNNLTGEIPDDIVPPEGKTTYDLLSTFKIIGNNFSGSIPMWVQENHRIQQANFSHQSFTGPFPKTLAEQPKLRLFHIPGNNLSGDLPDVNWENDLYEATMQNNNFTGSIPDSWSSMAQKGRGVWRLYMDGNNLSGEIPSWLATMPALEWLHLNNNRFTFKDILPHYDAILSNLESNAALGRSGEAQFYIDNQKPFGKSTDRSMSIGEQLILNLEEYHYQGNQYQWLKDGEPVEGATSPILIIGSITEEDEGTYVLEVENSALPELGIHPSQPITFQIGENDGLNDNGTDNSDGGDESNGDDTEPFQFPGAPVQAGPDSSSEGVSINPEFSWYTVDGTDYYELHASQTNPGGMILEVTVDDTVFVPEEIIGQDRLTHWRVRAVKDGEPGDWSPIWKFRTQEAELPEIADLVGPDHSAKNVSVTPELEWTSTQSEQYKLRLWKKGNSVYLIESESDTTVFTVADPLEEDAEFIWQVKSVIDGTEGAWGPRWEFSTGEYDYIVRAPHLWSPDQGEEHETLSPTFEWESVDADHYIISVTQDTPSNAKVLSSGAGSGEDDKTIILDEVPETVYTSGVVLEPETNYYWRVQGVKNGEEGEWSETWEFRTPDDQVNVSTYPGEKPLSTELRQNFPNPFNPTTHIEFTMAEPNNVSLKVYNMAGQLVTTLVEGVVQAGRHTATFDASSLASGVYLYRFVSGSHQFTEKMTLVK